RTNARRRHVGPGRRLGPVPPTDARRPRRRPGEGLVRVRTPPPRPVAAGNRNDPGDAGVVRSCRGWRSVGADRRVLAEAECLLELLERPEPDHALRLLP